MVTVAASTVLYTLVLAVGRDPLPALQTAAMPRLQPPEAPQHLAPVPATLAPSPFSDDDHQPAGRLEVTVRLTLPPGQQLPPDAGLATFDADTAADFRWHPIDSLAAEGDLRTLSTECAQDHTLTITFAASRAEARHGYLARRDVTGRRSDGAAAIVEMSGRMTDVVFELPVDTQRIGPLRLGRADDPQWVAMGHARIGLTVSQGTTLSLPLGDGDYELTDPLSSEHSQRFSVPQTTRVTIDARLSRARAGHR